MPNKGDLIKVEWYDISEDPVGNPSTGMPYLRTSYGLFWAQEVRKGIELLITTTTVDPDNSEQSGYCAYPIGCVKSMEVIKKAKVRKSKDAQGPTAV